MKYLVALDQGTSSSRTLVFDTQGRIVTWAQREFEQIYPQPGWVEHDPLDIWASQLHTLRQALEQAHIAPQDIIGVGITNQRETTLLWDRRTGQPLHNAIVWQDRRTEPLCAQLREAGLGATVQATTGLVIDPYFSGTKIAWLLDQVPGARALAEQGHLAFGTVDTWLLWQLTRGRVHATDVSNASRTLLFNIGTQQWDSDMLQRLNIPASVLPAVHPSSYHFGDMDTEWLGCAVPIAGMAGDQQSALFGQGCWDVGMAKNTYGTGCFMLLHTGAHVTHSHNGLISTCAAQPGQTPQYALEGSVFMGGAVVQWLRDGLGLIGSSGEVEALAASVPNSGGVVLVPAFTGLGAPYWQADARGTLVGLTRGTSRAHIAYAALQSIAFQSAALLQAMQRDLVQRGDAPVRELRVDGGACVNNLLMQMQADVLGIPVVRPAVVETTALGAAYLAGLHKGVWSSAGDLARHWQAERVFTPGISRDQAQSQMDQWERAVRQTLTP